jgi:hypothetical protein
MFNSQLQVLNELAAQIVAPVTDSPERYSALMKLPALDSAKSYTGIEKVLTIHATNDPVLPQCIIVRDKETGVFYRLVNAGE